MKKILTVIFASFALVSCVDTEILPEDKTVEEDFWKTKNDVEMMVNGAYASFASADNMRKIIVWSSRSDELNVNSSLNNSSLNQIEGGTIQTTNAYLGWGGFYSAINNCNLVISKSAEVRNIDPNYLVGDHNNNVGQMKALRALAYFYLIRAFRDVPLVLTPFKESSQEMNLPQTPAATVLNQIINDLESAKGMVLASETMSDWQRCGRITSCGVYAMLADAYLWRASITGSELDYKMCIQCCDYIRDHRAAAKAAGASVEKDDTYNLNDYGQYYSVFNEVLRNNDSEVLLQLMFEDNAALCETYNQYKYDSRQQPPLFYTNPVYAEIDSKDHVFNQTNSNKDVRGFMSVYGFDNRGDEDIRIRKYVAKKGINVGVGANLTESKAWDTYREENAAKHSHTDNNGVLFDPYSHPWVVYRVTDVMLMKAEAMVQLARLKVTSEETQNLVNSLNAANTDEQITSLTNELWPIVAEVSAMNVTAARQVQIVNTRARTDNASDVDSLTYSKKYPSDLSTAELRAAFAEDIKNYLSADKYVGQVAGVLETLVMDERARELCFEGRRWFDMLRYYYRQVYYDPAASLRYGTILADLGGNQTRVTEQLKTLMGRKYTSGGGTGVTVKFVTEPYLYFPIQQSEIELNPMLKQNPVYSANTTTEKNY